MEKNPSLAGLSPGEIGAFLNGLPAYRANQLYKWICSGVSSFDRMENLPLSLRKDLSEQYRLYSGEVSAELEDADGTVKLQITLEDKNKIEAVILTDGEGRKTACLSTQAGCPGGCVFCKTGSLGFKRNLNAREIAEQFLFLRQKSPDISHIVIMGMGEPLLNLEELRKALAFILDKEGLNISKRRITVSTSGVAAGIYDMADRGPDIRLALSLTTAREDLRSVLMPVTLSNPLPALKKSLVYYQKKTKGRFTLEAVLLGGINTTAADADAMAGFAKGLEVIVNIIPWNPVEGLLFDGRPLMAPTAEETAAFTTMLEKRGLKVTRRFEKGRGVLGACGQLGVVS
jgi:23S rRNA (adenine2503-C2)-methyltransferase